MQIEFPYRISKQGQTAREDETAHIRHLIEQVLFTIPGERVNRPDFGIGIQQLVFEGTDEHTLAATQFLVRGELERWLGEVIKVEGVEVEAQSSTIRILIQFSPSQGGAARSEVFVQ